LGPVKERIKNAINDGVITQDDPQVQTVIKNAINDGVITQDDPQVQTVKEEIQTLIQELKNTGVNPFD